MDFVIMLLTKGGELVAMVSDLMGNWSWVIVGLIVFFLMMAGDEDEAQADNA